MPISPLRKVYTAMHTDKLFSIVLFIFLLGDITYPWYTVNPRLPLVHSHSQCRQSSRVNRAYEQNNAHILAVRPHANTAASPMLAGAAS